MSHAYLKLPIKFPELCITCKGRKNSSCNTAVQHTYMQCSINIMSNQLPHSVRCTNCDNVLYFMHTQTILGVAVQHGNYQFIYNSISISLHYCG